MSIWRACSSSFGTRIHKYCYLTAHLWYTAACASAGPYPVISFITTHYYLSLHTYIYWWYKAPSKNKSFSYISEECVCVYAIVIYAWQYAYMLRKIITQWRTFVSCVFSHWTAHWCCHPACAASSSFESFAAHTPTLSPPSPTPPTTRHNEPSVANSIRIYRIYGKASTSSSAYN